jgi:curved DNA-binding protein CbpA
MARRRVNRMTFPKRDVRAMPARLHFGLLDRCRRIWKPLDHNTAPHHASPAQLCPALCAVPRTANLGLGSLRGTQKSARSRTYPRSRGPLHLRNSPQRASSTNMSGKSSGAQPSSGDAKNRSHHDGSSGRAFTVEQKAAVIRVKRCSPTAYYEILGLESVKDSCSDSDIKKGYRKLSLLTHPDKNGYDGADDAFKMISKAFQVLSDPDKKKKYDSFGGDPDARFQPPTGGGGGPAGFSGGGFPRGGGFQEEMTPEELFRQFFGGAFGGPFGTYGSNMSPTTLERATTNENQVEWTQAPASSSTSAADLASAYTSSAEAHRGDAQAPLNQLEVNRSPPSPRHSLISCHSFSSSYSRYSPHSSEVPPPPPGPP